MNKFTKSQLSVDGNSVHLSMPFAKVDESRRLVSGFATLDNVDTQGDVVLAEASANAFARARGNIREMHQPIAAGKIVDFREEEFFDNGNFYRGIFVTAYISEGAENTWKKVLDGTLTGFSIGGEINEATNEFVKEHGRTVRFIKDYDLTELSLVDNPANQLANVFSIQKSATGGMLVKGMVSETFIENVFVCKNDETVIVKDSAKEDCPVCGAGMENAGWFESGDNRVNKVNAIVSDFWNSSETEATPTQDSEGGVEVGKNNQVTKSETESEEVVEEVEETETEEETEEEEVAEISETDETDEEEEAADVEEVEDDEAEIAKRIEELHEAVKDSLEKTRNETSERVSELEQKIEKATEDFLSRADEIESKITGLVDNIETQKSRVAALESRIEKMNSSDAVRKSADLEKSEVKSVQSETSWNGAFSGRLSSFSVDDL